MRMNDKPATNWSTELYGEILARHATREGALLPILHDVQAALGYVPEAAIADIAHGLNLTRAEVHGTVSFYHDFRNRPPGRQVIRLCQAEACQARGARAVTAALEARLGVPLGQSTPDGGLSLEAVYCLGLCASGPSAMVGDRPVARLAPDALEALFDETAA